MKFICAFLLCFIPKSFALKIIAFKDFAFSYFIIFESRGLGVNLLLLFLIITTPKSLQNGTHFFVFSTT